MAKIYVASSWRNVSQTEIVRLLRAAGHEVYDFKNPKNGDTGFSWSEIDPRWQEWTLEQFIHNLDNKIAKAGFKSDYDAMKWADTCVLVMPCGRSAHIEAGYFNGAGKKLIILLSEAEPELMYKMADHLCIYMSEVIEILKEKL